MGILGSINNFISNNKIISNLVTPIPNLIQKILPNPVTKFVSEKPATTALIVAGGAAATLTKTGIAVTSTVVKALTPTTPKGVITAAIAAPVIIGVLSKTSKPLELVSSAPSKLTSFGKDLGTLIDNPSLRNAEALLKQNPGVSIALGTGAVIAGAGSLISAIGAVENIQTRNAVNSLTSELSSDLKNPSISNLPTGGSVVSDTSKTVNTTQTPFSPTTAITPASAVLPSIDKKGIK